MVVDASALCAICLREPEGEDYRNLLLAEANTSISALNLWEARVTVARRLPEASSVLEDLLDAGAVRIAPVGPLELELAWAAWRRFGKGRHPAALNMGDCFAYATAKTLNGPLLYKGNDFALTDIRAAYPPPAIKS